MDAEQGSPYSPWPLSFPKILGGLLYFEDHRPELSVSAEQCREILPQVEGMGLAWSQVMGLHELLRHLLTPAQEAYVWEHKRHLETAAGQAEAQALLDVAFAERSADAPSPTVEALCRLRSEEGPLDSDYARAAGERVITPQDISTGIVFMEQDPALRITPFQAAQILPLLEKFETYNQVVGLYFLAMLEQVNHDQIAGVQSDIAQIVPYKSKLYDDQGQSVRLDPLFDRVIALCETKTAD